MTEVTDDDTKIADVGQTEMRDFCAAIGELILWASLIDEQLNQALVSMFVLPEHALIESIVAQLDTRPKAELLKKRTKLISKNTHWKKAISNWVEHAEKANANRNIVAHHGIRIEAGNICLHSSQLGKIFGSLRQGDCGLEVDGRKGIKDINAWIEQARSAYAEGTNVLANLDHLTKMMEKPR